MAKNNQIKGPGFQKFDKAIELCTVFVWGKVSLKIDFKILTIVSF